MSPVVKLSYEEQILNALAHVEHPRGERDVIANMKREFDAIRRILRPLYDELAALRAKDADRPALCPSRRFRSGCPYPSVCREEERCVDGDVPRE